MGRRWLRHSQCFNGRYRPKRNCAEEYYKERRAYRQSFQWPLPAETQLRSSGGEAPLTATTGFNGRYRPKRNCAPGLSGRIRDSFLASFNGRYRPKRNCADEFVENQIKALASLFQWPLPAETQLRSSNGTALVASQPVFQWPLPAETQLRSSDDAPYCVGQALVSMAATGRNAIALTAVPAQRRDMYAHVSMAATGRNAIALVALQPGERCLLGQCFNGRYRPKRNCASPPAQSTASIQ